MTERLYATTDAAVWAEEFLGVVEAGATVDFGLMVGWFANAIETAKVAHDHDAMVEHLRNEWGTAGLVRVALAPVPVDQIAAVVSIATRPQSPDEGADVSLEAK